MIYTRNGTDALAGRYVVISPGTGNQHWGTTFFGVRTSVEPGPGPQATMSELQAHETILAHFHGVTMFQLFVAGSATMGKQELRPLTVQFKDHHTPYGPITAGPQGLSFVALRMYSGNSRPVYMGQPGARDELRPSKRRNLMSAPVQFSIEPVMQSRTEAVWENLFRDEDGMSADVVRLGAGMSVPAPDPRQAGGYYIFVGNGSMVHDGEALPLWSMAVVENVESGFEIRAGDKGLEALVLQYPRQEQQLH